MESPLPTEFLVRLRNQFSPSEYIRVIRAFGEPTLPTIRANTLLISMTELRKSLLSKSFVLEPVEGINDAAFVMGKTVRELTETDEYKKGLFYLQNPSSMLVSQIVDPHPGEHILDMAAAPGSKTLHLAALMKNEGTIVANDISPTRLFKLAALAKKYGVTIVTLSRLPGEKLWQKFPEEFDRVLLDAPCSGEGRFKTYDPKSFRSWSLRNVKLLAKQQRWLLRSAVSAAKVGGTIVYSTCTFSPEENEEVIDWILTKEKKSLDLAETRRIVPDGLFEGFYIAKLIKIASNV